MGELRIKQLEEELERVRSLLHDLVANEPSRLRDSRILPISQQLDQIIVEYQRAKQKKPSRKNG